MKYALCWHTNESVQMYTLALAMVYYMYMDVLLALHPKYLKNTMHTCKLLYNSQNERSVEKVRTCPCLSIACEVTLHLFAVLLLCLSSSEHNVVRRSRQLQGVRWELVLSDVRG